MTADAVQSDSVADFYDDLAADYDAMTGFERRFVIERPFFRLLVERYGITTALDAGCGTGFHALLLARLGVSTTAVDLSPRMIEKVAAHARELQLHVTAVRSDFQTLPEVLHTTFDAVFCLGNTLAHLLDETDLRSTFDSFFKLLKPGGTLFLQILNYERILTHQERVQSVKEVGDTIFVRFYDFEPDLLRFNLLKLKKCGDTLEQSLHSVRLNPIRHATLALLLPACGFADVSSYGAITLEEYTPEKSHDLVVIATKPH